MIYEPTGMLLESENNAKWFRVSQKQERLVNSSTGTSWDKGSDNDLLLFTLFYQRRRFRSVFYQILRILKELSWGGGGGGKAYFLGGGGHKI